MDFGSGLLLYNGYIGLQKSALEISTSTPSRYWGLSSPGQDCTNFLIVERNSSVICLLLADIIERCDEELSSSTLNTTPNSLLASLISLIAKVVSWVTMSELLFVVVRDGTL